MRVRDLNDMDVKPTFEPSDLARWAEGEWRSEPAVAVTGFSIDTRSIEEGDVFIAIKGEHSDGHLFIHDALANGAAAVMVERSDCLNGMNVPALIVSNTRKALMNVASHYRDTLGCRMIAVTGSVGKTTVKELTADMLKHVGVTARTKGNWNNDIGMPLSLLAAQTHSDYGVFEVGMNHPGELEPLCEVLKPDVSIVTCVGPVHIEHFENEVAIAHEKAAVLRALKGDGTAVIDADDAHADYLIEQADGSRVVTISSHNGADYVYKRIDPARGHFTLHEKDSGDVIDFHAALPGEYFVIDAVLSAVAARKLGVGWNPIIDTIRNYRPLSMRWNRHAWFGVHTVNDAYNANPVSVRAAIQAFLEEPAEGKRWLVLAGMLELGSDEKEIHEDLGAFVSRRPGLNLVVVGARGAWIAEGAIRAGMSGNHVHPCENIGEAAALLHGKLNRGDAVLFKASRSEAVESVLEEWIKLKEAEDEES